ncbi:DUF2513 domain-containing protein [Parvularcula oceani]|uniref:DUF2513 domain-containing protein n=1 Tax=Parvularcula oceani TaxID=1247963 RepID=UPI0006915E16|nr:DUF2513 domain-containing protein [Parvularcula oceani]
MKRNMDLVRQLLLAIEAQGPIARGMPNIDGYARDEIDHHLTLLRQAGFLPQIERPRQSELPVRGLARRVSDPVELTWKGHDFLDTIHDEGVWSSTKEAVGKVGGTAALETWKAAATAVSTAAVTASIAALRGGA